MLLNQQITNLNLNLDDQLQFVSQENENIVKRAELSFKLCKTTLDKLRIFILKYKFKTQGEEIKFFKEIKPIFYSKLIYH